MTTVGRSQQCKKEAKPVQSRIQELDPEGYNEITSGGSQMDPNKRAGIHLPKRRQEESSSSKSIGTNKSTKEAQDPSRRTDVIALRKHKYLENLSISLTCPGKCSKY